MKDYYQLDSYKFDVPQELIALYPVDPRDHARLMIVERETGRIEYAHVYNLPSILDPNDALIFNDTRVLHARLFGRIEGGRTIECLLTKKISPYEWSALSKPARFLKSGVELIFSEDIRAIVTDIAESGERILRFSKEISFADLSHIGSIPLPPYINRKVDANLDEKRYQTIYGKNLGSVAAPTAGLHFTQDVFENFYKKGISSHFVTLHVGTGTFLPVRTKDVREHTMHYESYEVSPETAHALNNLPQGSRRVAVGTTSCRVLETVVKGNQTIQPGENSTNLFIYPGYNFQYVNTLFTNFHTPESSLLVLVAAFMGYDLMVEAYRKAIENKFRLFSYGDAMLIL